MQLWRLRSTDGIRSSPSLSPKAGEKSVSQLKDSLAERKIIFLTDAFSLFRPSMVWVSPTYIGEKNLLYSVRHFKFQSHPETTTDTPRNNV